MAKKRKHASKQQPFEDSRSFAMMNIWPVEQPKKLSASLRQLGKSSALSAYEGVEVISKEEVPHEPARRPAEKVSSKNAARTHEATATAPPVVSCPDLREAVRREHSNWLRWARRADKAALPGLKKLTKAQKRRLFKRKPEFEGQPRFEGGAQLSQGGLPTLGKRR
jgi:hypothetical protein